jgi:glucosamine--fructose-6-phosphate aminotransferase (isomerizing)
MCGLFGWMTKNESGPDLGRLRRIAIETQSRGNHAFGLAWLGADGRIRTFKRPGPATANLGDLDRVRDALIVVGHCRWATHGDPRDNRTNHPHRAGRGMICHNGVVANHVSLIRRSHLAPETECDSEVLGLLIARFSGPLVQRAARAAEATDGKLAILGVWRKPARLLIVRRGNPLCVGETKDGLYFGSLSGELPGHVRSIPDYEVSVIGFEHGRLWQQVQPVLI